MLDKLSQQSVSYADHYYTFYENKLNYNLTYISHLRTSKVLNSSIIILKSFNLQNNSISNQIKTTLYSLLCNNIYIFAPNYLNSFIKKIAIECNDDFISSHKEIVFYYI